MVNESPPFPLRGDESPDEALPRLMQEYGGQLYSLALRFCGQREEAEDLVQETFLQAYRGWRAFEGRSSPGTWLYTIAARLCQRAHRRRSGEPERVQSLDELLPFGEARMAVAPEASDPMNSEVRAEARRDVEAALAQLPVNFRMPLLLKEILGLSVEATAEVLGIAPATVKTRLHRARLRLRKALERALPTREVPPAVYSRQVCLDLLHAKQEALDREVAFEFPDQAVCERCSELFATLDLTQAVCRDLARGELPDELRRSVLERAALK